MTTSGPPPASCWAKPPEFLVDVSLGGRTVSRHLRDLGYVVHTLAEIFGSKHEASARPDTAWLALARKNRWVILGRDAAVLRKPDELAAYRAARVHMVLFEGQLTREQIITRLDANLTNIITITTSREPQVIWVDRTGVRTSSVGRGRRRL